MSRPIRIPCIFIIFSFLLTTPLLAYYNPSTNLPDGPPANYNLIEGDYFQGSPPFATLDESEVGGYYIYQDESNGRWNIISVVYPGGVLYEQLHGSVLVELETAPTEGVNVWPLGFYLNEDLTKNDRWGWVKMPDDLGENLYEIWWDITVDYPRLQSGADPYDTIGFCFSGCAFDFNIWGTGHYHEFTADQIYLGQNMVPLSSVPGFVDTFSGLEDQYQGEILASEPNTSVFTSKALSGATYNMYGLVTYSGTYGETYGGPRAYEGDGFEFSVNTCPPDDDPPYFDPPLGYVKSFTFCLGESVEDTIIGVDVNADDLLTINLISGPGTLESVEGNPPVYGYYSFTPTESGVYKAIFEVVDSSGNSYVDSARYDVVVNYPPELTAFDTTIAVCSAAGEICLDFSGTDGEGDEITYELLSGSGSLDPVTGELCFTPGGVYNYTFVVEASDSCGADTAEYNITIEFNYPPSLDDDEIILHLCEVEEICFDVTASDPDEGDSISIQHTYGPGTFTQTGNGVGVHCFIPNAVDSAQYVFHYQVADNCGRGEVYSKLCPPPTYDSIIVIVVINQPPNIVCPDDQDEFICGPTEFCYDITATDYENDDIIFALLEGPGSIDPTTGHLCFTAESQGEYYFEIAAADTCGADTCGFTVTVGSSQPPQVTVGDTTVFLCEATEVCLPVDITVEGNITNIEVSEPAYYDSDNERVCLYVEEPGTYDITVTVYDDCQNSAAATGTITATFNSAPVVTVPDDTVIDGCELTEICLSGFSFFDTDDNIEVIEFEPSTGTYTDGTYCLPIDGEGEYCITARAIDECGAVDEETVCVQVNLGTTATIDCPEGIVEISLCDESQVCYSIAIDPNDADVVVTGDLPATYENGQLCFTATESGLYSFQLSASSVCGDDYCEVTFNVTYGETPIIECPPSGDLYLCEPGLAQLPLLVYPDNAVVTIEPDDDAVYEDGFIIFHPDSEGQYCFTVTAATDCDTVECSFCVDITMNSPPTIELPDAEVFLCEPSTEVCVPFYFSDPDDDIDTIAVYTKTAEVNEGQLCFIADTAGVYELIVGVADSCGNSDIDTGFVTVTMNQMPSVNVGVRQVFLCEKQDVCVPVTYSDPDGEIDSVVVTAPAYLNDAGDSVCVYVENTGAYSITVTVYDDCGASVATAGLVLSIMNQLPVVTVPDDQEIKLCGPEQICLPGFSIKDIDGNLVDESIYPEGDSFEDGVYCFTPDTAGVYCIVYTAYDECGSAEETVCVTVTYDSPPVVSIPDSTLIQCELAEICLPVDYSDVDGNFKELTVVEPADAVIFDDHICFTPGEVGSYRVIVAASDTCGNITEDTAMVNVSLNQPPVVSVEDSSLFICEPTTVCMKVNYSDVDGLVETVEVIMGSGTFYPADSTYCVDVDTSGVYKMAIDVWDDCGNKASDTAELVITKNTDPTVVFDPDPVELCYVPQKVCFPIDIDDIDGNLESVIVNSSGGSAAFNTIDSTVCITPTAFGDYTITVTVLDDCGASASERSTVSFLEAPHPDPHCPPNDTIIVCEPGVGCLEVESLGYDVRINPATITYDSEAGTLCLNITENGTQTVWVVDSTMCGKDSCSFELTTLINRAPVITGETETIMQMCEPFTLCVAVEISDPDDNIAQVTVTGDCPAAFYDDGTGEVCIDIYEEVHCTLIITVTDECGLTDVLQHQIDITPNTPPVLYMPEIGTIVRCESDSTELIITDICIDDYDYNEVTLELDSGLGEFEFDPNTNCGTLYFLPPTNDAAEYCFKFKGADFCDTVYDRFCLTIEPTAVCSTCVEISLVGPPCVVSGSIAEVGLVASAFNDLGGFDLLIGYDATVLTFLSTRKGSVISSWEYYTYRYGPDGNCSGSCPSGILRIVAIADVNDGVEHPDEEQLQPDGTIGIITFSVSGDQLYGGRNIPVYFYWGDCADNSFSDPSGQYQLVDQRIFNAEGSLVWDETNDALYPEDSRILNHGTPDSCLTGDKEAPVRCVNFYNGDVCILHPDDVDDRGDLNMNGISYEIADAVLYTNYFISGLSVFTIALDGQIAASDTNADGLTLSLADLVYLIRVIIGDALPYPKPILPGEETVDVGLSLSNGHTSVTFDSPQDIGAALLIFDYNGTPPENISLSGDASGMDMKYGYLDNTLRVLVFSLDEGDMIPSGISDVIDIQPAEDGTIELIEVEVVDYYGQMLKGEISTALLPTEMSLSQNYPNPFNPTTTFELALPQASDYEVTIYNITGQAVRKWVGHGQAGVIKFDWNATDQNDQLVASGVYFYRAKAVGAEKIRKMVLIK